MKQWWNDKYTIWSSNILIVLWLWVFQGLKKWCFDWENPAFLFDLCCINRQIRQDLHYELPIFFFFFFFFFPPFHLVGVPPSAGGAPAGTGWPGQSARFLHRSHRIYYQSRCVHDTVVARLTPEDIKKAREAKQAQVKPVRQKVGWRTWNHAIIFLY